MLLTLPALLPSRPLLRPPTRRSRSPECRCVTATLDLRTAPLGELAQASVQHERGAPGLVAADLRLLPQEALAPIEREGLDDRLLGGEARRQVPRRIPFPLAVRDLAERERLLRLASLSSWRARPVDRSADPRIGSSPSTDRPARATASMTLSTPRWEVATATCESTIDYAATRS
jgi:hypothetical protein